MRKNILLPIILIVLGLIFSPTFRQELVNNLSVKNEHNAPSVAPPQDSKAKDDVVTGEENEKEGEVHSSPDLLIPTEAGQKEDVQGAQTKEGKGEEATVVHVTDGDTISVLTDGRIEKVRIIGIDTPETVDPRKPVQCFGKEASNYAKDKLTGRKVQLETDPSQQDRDKYHRLLRFVWLENGTLDFGRMIIENGYAHEYTYFVPYKYQVEYKQAEREARGNKLGLWADHACT